MPILCADIGFIWFASVKKLWGDLRSCLIWVPGLETCALLSNLWDTPFPRSCAPKGAFTVTKNLSRSCVLDLESGRPKIHQVGAFSCDTENLEENNREWDEMNAEEQEVPEREYSEGGEKADAEE